MLHPRTHGILALLLVLSVSLGAGVVVDDVLPVGAFSEADPGTDVPEGWMPISFADIETRTSYDLVRVDSTVVVRARSDSGAAGLATKQRVDLREYPILEWRWRVDDIVEGGNARTKSGDDFAARIYVTFDFDDLGFADQIKLVALRTLGYDDIPTRALNYVWANRVDRHTILENAYTDWVMMVAVRSGRRDVGTWITERRNVLQDYRAAFGGDPPPVNGIAIMTDTDNTGGSATAYYGDIVFRSGDIDPAGDPGSAGAGDMTNSIE